MQRITKRFGSFCANDCIDFCLKKGEIHALLGENGAGKTTLMNILYGIYTADEGSICVNGKPESIVSPRNAIACGIGMVHQHFMLVTNFTVAQNMVLGQKDRFWLKIPEVEKKLEELSAKYGLKINPRAKVSELSVGEQERVEIMKALYREAQILILDEPTAVLTPQETKDLFAVLRSLSQSGISIIIITHKLEEVMEITDRVTVLRLGKKIATVNTAQTNKHELAKMMVGRDVLLNVERPNSHIGETVLELKDVFASDNRTKKLNGISLSVREGEIFGVAGVDGNGQRELARAIYGLLDIEEGEICFCGKRIDGSSVERVIRSGISYIPEDRILDGLLGEFAVEDNFIIQTLDEYTRFGLFSNQKIRRNAQRLIEEYDVRTNGPTQAVKYLSGGNQQKLIFAREFERAPKLLIASQPTRGLDIGAIEYVWSRIMNAKSRGAAILLISTELEEILTLSDRIAVLYEGRIAGDVVAREDADIQRIGLLMAGAKKEENSDV